jgi:hypothetical protein
VPVSNSVDILKPQCRDEFCDGWAYRQQYQRGFCSVKDAVQNDRVTAPVAAAAHLVLAIFTIVKRFDAHVGRNTEIIAWRASASADEFFVPDIKLSVSKAVALIDENLKVSLQWAMETRRTGSEVILERTIQKIAILVREDCDSAAHTNQFINIFTLVV